MHLNYVFEGSHESGRWHLLQVMRELMLTGQYAPMNVNLFYDQFLNEAQLTDTGQARLNQAKAAWLQEFKHYSCYLDYGLENDIREQIMQLSQDTENKIDLNFMTSFKQAIPNMPDLHSLAEYNQLVDALPSLTDMASTSAEQHRNDISHEHLPLHFSTYYNQALHNTIPVEKVDGAMKRVIFESPFAGDMTRNSEYAASCIAKLLLEEGVAPMASHLLYTRMLDDNVPAERTIGIDAGLEYGRHAQETIIAVDRGLSTGMKYGIANAEKAGRALSFFTLSSDPKVQHDVRSLRDVNDLEAWVSQSQAKASPELSEKGWLQNVDDNAYLNPKDKINNTLSQTPARAAVKVG